MSKLLALAVLLAAAIAAVLFWRKREGSWDSVWSSAKDSSSEWSTTATHESGKAVETVAAAADDAATAATNLADEVKGGNPV